MKKKWPKVFSIVLVSGLAILLVLQLVPYGRDHQNPPVVQEPNWDSPETRAMAVRSCYDCHSNETVWPWYSSIAPMSWLVQRDVDRGRQKLNFSNIQASGDDLDELAEVVIEGEMPLPIYLPAHPNAKLTESERHQLAQGFTQTFGLEYEAEGD